MSSFIRVNEVIFWLSLNLITYTYFIYPLLLFFLYSLLQLWRDWRYLGGRRNRRVAPLDHEAVEISFLIPAYNEEAHLLEKINNLRVMDYPRDKMQILVVSDGSTDATNQILKNIPDPNVEVIFLPQRSGKANALNQGVLRARHEILVFSDASTLFAPDAVRNLARHFTDPGIGAVCGALRFHASSESQQTEGIYWKYESMIRLMEGRLGATLTASGAVYALRRKAYLPLDSKTILDDFVIPMNARREGYRVVYDPEAIATDYAPEDIEGEFTRRVRLATGSFASLMHLLRIPMGGFGRFAFVSHKLLRWILPLILCTLLISNAALFRQPAYAAFGLLQLFFYSWAGIGYLLRKHTGRMKFVLLPYFMLAMNFAFLVGLLRSFSKQGVIWQRVN